MSLFDEAVTEIPSSQEDERSHSNPITSRSYQSLPTASERPTMFKPKEDRPSVFSSPSIVNTYNKRKSEPLAKTMMKDKYRKLEESLKQEEADSLFDKLKFGEASKKNVIETNNDFATPPPGHQNINYAIDLEVRKLKDTNNNLRDIVGKLKRTK